MLSNAVCRNWSFSLIKIMLCGALFSSMPVSWDKNVCNIPFVSNVCLMDVNQSRLSLFASSNAAVRRALHFLSLILSQFFIEFLILHRDLKELCPALGGLHVCWFAF